ncbi:hypothetical protein Efla_002902 [Eimeria flavescens]
MAPKGPRRKQKSQVSPETPSEFHVSQASKFAGVSAPENGEVPATKNLPSFSLSEATTHFTRNYVGSILFHVHLAFLPALLCPALKKTVLFANWSPNALTLLAVFVANASWAELFDNGCVTDPISALIGFRQEMGFCEACGSKLSAARRMWWLLDGVSGLLGAVTVGLLTALLSPLQPFGALLPLPQEAFLCMSKKPLTSASLLTDFLRAFATDEQLAAFASWLKALSLAAVARCPAVAAPLLYGLQHSLEKVSSVNFFRVCSLLLDTFIAEFLCCFVFFLVVAVVTSTTCFFELKNAGRIKLAVLLLAVAAGLPYCGVVGGPMLGVSFSALVAASRLDPCCFLLTASAALAAALCATRLVRPIPVALADLRRREDLKKNQ